MLEALDSVLILVAGGWILLLATGRIRLSRNPNRARHFQRRAALPLAILGTILMAWGAYRLIGFIMAGNPS